MTPEVQCGNGCSICMHVCMMSAEMKKKNDIKTCRQIKCIQQIEYLSILFNDIFFAVALNILVSIVPCLYK